MRLARRTTRKNLWERGYQQALLGKRMVLNRLMYAYTEAEQRELPVSIACHAPAVHGCSHSHGMRRHAPELWARVCIVHQTPLCITTNLK